MLPNLKQLRREAGISQQALADVLGMSQQSVNHYENDNTQPDIQTLKQMADYFHTSIDYIVGHTDIRDRIEPTTAYHLNEAEADLITRYRSLSPKQRACVAQVIETLLDK